MSSVPTIVLLCHLHLPAALQIKKEHRELHFQGQVSSQGALGLTPDAVDSCPVTSLLHTADIPMHVLPQKCIPILPSLLHQLCLLFSGLAPSAHLFPSLHVCLTFGFIGMLHQSNLASSTPVQFHSSRHTCTGDIIPAPPGLLIVIHWILWMPFINCFQLLSPPTTIIHSSPTLWMDVSSQSQFPCYLVLCVPGWTPWGLTQPFTPSIASGGGGHSSLQARTGSDTNQETWSLS